MFEGQGTPKEWGVVLNEKGHNLGVGKSIKSSGEEEPAESGFRLFALGPGPERPFRAILRTPNPANGAFAPFSTRQISAGQKATPVCGIIARVGNPN